MFSNRVCDRNPELGSHASEILTHAIQAVDPYDCVYNQVHVDGDRLIVGNKAISLRKFERIFLIGFGKAAVPMALACIDRLDEKIHQAHVITKDPKFLIGHESQCKLTVHLGGHPIPDINSIQSTQAVLRSLPDLIERDLVLVVISGGGSALFTDPIPGVSLDDIQKMTQLLIHCGADIYEINTLRKHLDQVKGGRLAERLQPAQVESIILSDVIGDRLDMIASGPTVPDPTTFEDTVNILTKYHLEAETPVEILRYLEQGKAGDYQETLKPGQISQDKVDNHLVGTNYLAAQAALSHAKSLGYHSAIISTELTGRTVHVAEFLAGIVNTVVAFDQPVAKPACLIFGGEPTVNVTGEGLGGRNMDLALRMVPMLADKTGVLFVSLATDGEDGPTDAAGAAVDGDVFRDGKDHIGLNIASFIKNNDSYHYFDQVGGLIKTGATGTNVNDLVIILLENI